MQTGYLFNINRVCFPELHPDIASTLLRSNPAWRHYFWLDFRTSGPAPTNTYTLASQAPCCKSAPPGVTIFNSIFVRLDPHRPTRTVSSLSAKCTLHYHRPTPLQSHDQTEAFNIICCGQLVRGSVQSNPMADRQGCLRQQ